MQNVLLVQILTFEHLLPIYDATAYNATAYDGVTYEVTVTLVLGLS